MIRLKCNAHRGMILMLAAASLTPRPTRAQVLELVTSDIDNFWQAYDASEPGNRVRAIQSLYFDRASPGLSDFIRLRLTSAENLANTVDRLPKFYGSIRESTMKAASQRELIELYAGRFRGLYPEASFPPVYFLIGRASTGGTVGPSGLLIGTEVFSLGAGVDASEIEAANPAFFRAMGQIDRLPLIVIHELVHFQQRFNGRRNLLTQSMIEGAADYITSVVSGRTINDYATNYAEAHRRELFERFAKDYAERPDSATGWLYNYSATAAEPADLGYWIGHEICRDYFTRAADKNSALREVMLMSRPEEIVRASAYAWILEPAER